MLERACYAVEQAGRGGGVFPEVLVDVARQWDWIHQQVGGIQFQSIAILLHACLLQVNESGDNDAARTATPAVSTASVSQAPVVTPGTCVVPNAARFCS